MKGLSEARTVLYYTSYPVVLLLKTLLYAFHWLATPFTYLAYYAYQVMLVPFRFIARYETLFYFIGGAILLGSFSGLFIHSILRFTTKTFDLDRSPPPKAIPAKGHDAASYRAAREAKRQERLEKEQRNAMRARLLASQPLIQEVVREARRNPISGPIQSPKSPNTSTAATKSGLFQEIILEHTDEDEDSAF